jgi:hypothetical protein
MPYGNGLPHRESEVGGLFHIRNRLFDSVQGELSGPILGYSVASFCVRGSLLPSDRGRPADKSVGFTRPHGWDVL